MNIRTKLVSAALSLLVAASGACAAEQTKLRISKQYGLGYLPLVVLEGRKLLEKNAKEAGLGDLAVEWITFAGGVPANDALLAGNVDLISGGVAPAVILWDKTQGAARILAALNESPLVLNTSNPNVKTLRDLTENDRIALPSVKVSIQAITLSIAAVKEFGPKEFARFDPLTVALPHPDALIALTSGKSEITGHFTSEPFITLEQRNPNVRQVLSSYDLFGRHTNNIVTTSKKFYDANPKLVSVIIKSLNEANEWIAANKNEAARLYLEVSKSREPIELIKAILDKSENTFSTKPLNLTVYSDFLHEIGRIKKKPTERDLFFPKIFEQGNGG
ncbi:MAG: ABC transporter substrate-binding protein [Candidatus Accumulibacter sp.]|jgi:NitT/TauT family transport system substrate-binding protein|nr:ABC transporter substrate-binding protein [Accumulibacter sp.]